LASTVIGSLRVNLGIDTAAFIAGLQNATKHLDRVGKQMQAIGRQMSSTITAPMALVGTGILKMSADFEQAMSNISAVLRPTQEEFKKLGDLAVLLAQTTKYTAKEAADGMEMLARNGIDAANILGGAATATLNLASAANASLPSAADAMTDVMVAFKKTGPELTDVVNNIAGTLVNSKMGWEDYFGAMSQAAGIAGSSGMSFSDMNAILAATAPAFKNGTEAGTSFKGFLLKLAPSSKQAKEIMRDLNLEFFNAQGFMKTAGEIAEELRTKVGKLTKQSQVEVLGALFGQRTIRTALRLMEEGAAGIERFREKIAKGDAEQMAKTRLDNFWGSWNMLRAAVESAAIAIGNSGFLAWARSAVDSVAEFARSVAALNPELLRFIAIMGTLVTVAGPAIAGIGLLVAGIVAIGGPISWTIVAIAALVTAITAYWDEIKIATRMLTNVFSDVYESIKGWCVSVYGAVKEWLVDKFGWAIDGLTSMMERVSNAFSGLTELDDVKREAQNTQMAIDKAFDGMKASGVAAGKAVSFAWRQAAADIKREADEAKLRLEKMAKWRKVFARRRGPSKDQLASGLPTRRSSDEVDLGTYGIETFDSSQYEDGERIIKQLKKSTEALAREGKRVFDETRTPAEALRIELTRLDNLVNSGSIDFETYSRAVKAAKDEFSGYNDLVREGKSVFEATRTPAEALRLEFERLNKLVNVGAIDFDTYTRAVAQAQNEFTGLNRVAENVSQSFGSALEDMLIDGASWRDSLAGFLKDIAREILRVAALTPLMNSIKQGITSAFGSGGGGFNLGSLFSSLPGFADGGSFQVGGTGGIDSQLVAFRASPNERVTITKPGQARGAVSVSIPIQIDASGADTAAVARLERGLDQAIGSMRRVAVEAVSEAMDRNIA